MSHWAEIDDNNIVIRVLVGSNDEPDEGESFFNSLGGTWIKASYNRKIRYNFPSIGYTYDPIDDAFVSPKTCNHNEIILNDKKQWECSNVEHEAQII